MRHNVPHPCIRPSFQAFTAVGRVHDEVVDAMSPQRGPRQGPRLVLVQRLKHPLQVQVVPHRDAEVVVLLDALRAGDGAAADQQREPLHNTTRPNGSVSHAMHPFIKEVTFVKPAQLAKTIAYSCKPVIGLGRLQTKDMGSITTTPIFI